MLDIQSHNTRYHLRRYSRGIDDRDVLDESDVKSFSSEASYGVRTKSTEEAYTYVEEIAIKALQNMLRAGFSARRIQVRCGVARLPAHNVREIGMSWHLPRLTHAVKHSVHHCFVLAVVGMLTSGCP